MTEWKWATRNKLLWTWKSIPGTDIKTPASPPDTNVIIKPMNQSIGVVNFTRPRNIVNSQLKTFTPVGIATIMVMIPKKEFTFAPPPIVKKWWSQTTNDINAIATIAHTIEV